MFRIIIADDHPAVLQAVTQLLQEEFPSAYIEEARDTKALLDKALNQQWDLVVTDLAMPGEGGFAALKKLNRQKSLPVIVISTYPAEQYLVRVLRAGGEDFVAKDSLPGGLTDAIRNIFKHKK